MLFVCSLALISCASEAVGVRCTPGQVVECPCGGGARGVQSCADNGAYGACTCADAAPPGVDADGASATPDVAGDVVNVMDGPADVEPSRDVTDAGADASTDDGAEAAADVVAADVVAADVVAADLAEELGCSSGALCGGRCVDVAADLRHCGRCGNDCAALTGVDPTAARCVGGACRIEGACLPSRAHCSSNPQDGCETDVTTPARCGDCSTRCAEPNPLCSLLVDAAGGRRYACVSGCPAATPARCGGTCVDVSADPAHCGACANACPAPSNGTASCRGGLCAVTCRAGTHLCGGSCVDDASPATCGTSCTPCPAASANATVSCEGGRCGFTCNAGFHRCAGACVGDREVTSCGTSCTPCAAPANATATCDGATCGFVCNPGYTNVRGACEPAVADGTPDSAATQVSGITLLQERTSGRLLVVYQDNETGGGTNVRLARYEGTWTVSTLLPRYSIERQGAGLDVAGTVHLAVSRSGDATPSYSTHRLGVTSGPTPIPGLPPGSPTLDVDDAGRVHVTHNVPLSTRFYTSNASGTWPTSAAVVASSATAPASILAAGLPAPVITHANWSGRSINFSQGPTWGSAVVLGRYGVDQGPSQALHARSGALHFVYMLTTDAYTNYALYYLSRPAGGDWSGAATLSSGHPALAGIDITLDDAGVRYATVCERGGAVRVHVNRSGSWASGVVAVPSCAGSLDTLVTNGRLYLAYRGATGRLTVASALTAGL